MGVAKGTRLGTIENGQLVISGEEHREAFGVFGACKQAYIPFMLRQLALDLAREAADTFAAERVTKFKRHCRAIRIAIKAADMEIRDCIVSPAAAHTLDVYVSEYLASVGGIRGFLGYSMANEVYKQRPDLSRQDVGYAHRLALILQVLEYANRYQDEVTRLISEASGRRLYQPHPVGTELLRATVKDMIETANLAVKPSQTSVAWIEQFATKAEATLREAIERETNT